VWASLTFLIAPFGQQFNYLLQKHLQFKLLCFIKLASAFIGTSVAVVAALLDQGVYSLIWGQLVKTGIGTAGYMYFGYSKWPPEFHFNWKELKGYLSFGMYQLGDRTTNYFSKNIDYILIGRYLGPEVLGQYTIAFQLVVIPIQKINSILTKVAFPLFAKRQDKNSSLRYGYLQMTKILTGVVYPLLIGLAATAPLAIPLFLGEGWELSIILIQILMVVGLARTLGNPSGSLYLAKGRADIGFIFNLCTAVISGIVFWYFVEYGAAVLAGSFAVLNIMYVLVHIHIISRLIDLSYSAYAAAISTQIILRLIMGGITYGIYLSLVSTVVPSVLLGIQIVAGVGFYIAATMIIEREFVQEFYTLLKGDKKSPKKMNAESEAQ
jgi:O-antigen/teichoic acid export membrane protein